MFNECKQFRAAILAVGLNPPSTIEPGRFHRFPGIGKDRSNDAGWCKLFSDGRGGVFGDFSTGLDEHWQAEADQQYSAEQREAFRLGCEAERRTREAEEHRRHVAAAAQVISILDKAIDDPSTHPYALTKGVPLGSKVKRGAWPQRGWTDSLLIPVFGADGQIWTIEAINTDGEKDYLKGGRKRGGFYPLGKIRGANRVLIGEGLATVAAVHAIDGAPGVVAMDAGNLTAVALVVRSLVPEAELVFLADNDIKSDGSNPGLKSATDAAQAIQGIIAIPELGGRKCDFWDVWHELGSDAVREALAHAQPITPNMALSSPNDLGGSSWLKPQPLTEKITAEAYPLDALPNNLRAAVEEVLGFTKAPVVLVASSALASLSLATEAYVDIKRAEKLTGPTSLFLLSIADSGERKSTCDGFFSKPIQAYEQEQVELAKPLQKDYAAALSAWNAEREGVLSAIKDAGKKGKPVAELRDSLTQVEHNKPEPPRIPKLIRGDETPENLAYVLAKEWPAGGVMSSEAGVVLGAHGMGRDSIMRNLGLLNILWDGGELPVGRRSSESFIVRGARLTVALQVQEATLRSFFERSGGLARGTGFFARFLVAWPESTQGYRRFTDPPESWPKLATFHRRITEILSIPAPIDAEGALNPVMLTFTPEAKKAWVAFHDALENELRTGGELYDVRDVASKTADNAARLSALFHVFEYGFEGAVGFDSFESGSRIAAWHLHEARRFFGELALPIELANAVRLDNWLLDYCKRQRTDRVPRRELQRLGPVRDKEPLKNALKELEDLGRIRVIQEERRKEIHINPQLLNGVAT